MSVFNLAQKRSFPPLCNGVSYIEIGDFRGEIDIGEKKMIARGQTTVRPFLGYAMTRITAARSQRFNPCASRQKYTQTSSHYFDHLQSGQQLKSINI
jgi:hypothetical protein